MRAERRTAGRCVYLRSGALTFATVRLLLRTTMFFWGERCPPAPRPLIQRRMCRAAARLIRLLESLCATMFSASIPSLTAKFPKRSRLWIDSAAAAETQAVFTFWRFQKCQFFTFWRFRRCHFFTFWRMSREGIQSQGMGKSTRGGGTFIGFPGSNQIHQSFAKPDIGVVSGLSFMSLSELQRAAHPIQLDAVKAFRHSWAPGTRGNCRESRR